MAGRRIFLIGCGEIGSRHLQALVGLENVSQITIIDKNEDSLKLGQLRLNECRSVNKSIRFQWLKNITKECQGGDLCIVATQAQGRCALIKNIAENYQCRYFLIEKIVAQSIPEYSDLKVFSSDHDLKIWVNCKNRAYAVHKFIKSRLVAGEPIYFSDCGGNQGLANNGVHAADLFVYYDNATSLKGEVCRIDPILHPSKRGKDIFDLSGTLHVSSEKGNSCVISFAQGRIDPDVLTIITPRHRFVVDHLKKFAYQSSHETDWQWKPFPMEENVFISHMTTQFAHDILTKGTCDLPTLEECYPAHKFILETLLPHFNRLMKTNNDFCPVT